jgi:hypothetical protein
MASKIDRAHDLIDQIAEDARQRALKDVAIDLRDTLKDCTDEERAGWAAAIEFIKANYGI